MTYIELIKHGPYQQIQSCLLSKYQDDERTKSFLDKEINAITPRDLRRKCPGFGYTAYRYVYEELKKRPIAVMPSSPASAISEIQCRLITMQTKLESTLEQVTACLHYIQTVAK